MKNLKSRFQRTREKDKKKRGKIPLSHSYAYALHKNAALTQKMPRFLLPLLTFERKLQSDADMEPLYLHNQCYLYENPNLSCGLFQWVHHLFLARITIL